MGYGNKVTETREYIHEEIVLGRNGAAAGA